MRYIILFIFVIPALFIQLYCNNSINDMNSQPGICKKYYSSDSLLMLELTEYQDSLKGAQCFTTFGLNRIDFCENQTSIFLKKITENIFKGKMESCYDEQLYDVQILISNDTLTFILLTEGHEFLPKKSILYFYGQCNW